MRWKYEENGIVWDVLNDKNLPHEDHMEMSGQKVSLIVRYGVAKDGSLVLHRRLVWPMLRTIPNNTHASFMVDADSSWLPGLTADGKPFSEYPEHIRFDGVLEIVSRTDIGLRVTRKLFPSVDTRSVCECVSVTNVGAKACHVAVAGNGREIYGRGCNGVYIVHGLMTPRDTRVLKPDDTLEYSLQLSARIANEPFESVDAAEELRHRRARVAELQAPLDLHTGIAEIDAEFRMCKLRAGESIFATRGGFMHSPGGGSYYAATWCNDQVESGREKLIGKVVQFAE